MSHLGSGPRAQFQFWGQNVIQRFTCSTTNTPNLIILQIFQPYRMHTQPSLAIDQTTLLEPIDYRLVLKIINPSTFCMHTLTIIGTCPVTLSIDPAS